MYCFGDQNTIKIHDNVLFALNSFHKKIKFTSEIQKDIIPFPDI